MSSQLPFKVFSNCQLVKGANRSAVCDLQRNQVHTIPSILYEILSEFNGRKIEDVKQHYGFENSEMIDDYFDFLFKEEIIFFTKTPERFPGLDLQWHSATAIQNCIIDIGTNSEIDIDSVIKSLNNLDCRYLEIRSYTPLLPDKIDCILNSCHNTTIASVNLIIPINLAVREEEWLELCDRQSRITSIIIHSANNAKSTFSPGYCIPVQFIDRNITSEKCCGIISDADFIASMPIFTESQKRNTCLNGKISIDAEGNIKNCPSMSINFGSIKETTLENVVHLSEFQKAWFQKKDDIAVCRDCEFRHVCTDCRAYTEAPDDPLSKPLKCGYDPYTCEWEEWSTHPMKQYAIGHYKLQDTIRTINKIN